jgi:hypothetical protein
VTTTGAHDRRSRAPVVVHPGPRPHAWLNSPTGKRLHAGGCRSRAHGCTRRSRASETWAAFFAESCIAPGQTALQEPPPRSLKVGLNWADAWRGWRARNPENGESRGSHLSRGAPQGRGKSCGRRTLAAPDCRSCGAPRCWRSTSHQDRTSGRGWTQFSDSCCIAPGKTLTWGASSCIRSDQPKRLTRSHTVSRGLTLSSVPNLCLWILTGRPTPPARCRPHGRFGAPVHVCTHSRGRSPPVACRSVQLPRSPQPTAGVQRRELPWPPGMPPQPRQGSSRPDNPTHM